MINRWFVSSINVFVGLFFILSGWLKLNPLEVFKFVIAENLFIKRWMWVEIFSRLLIGIELLLGCMLILHVNIKKTLIATEVFLLIMSLYLVYLLLYAGDTEDCGCMGETFKMSPALSLLKNIVLIGLLWYAYRYSPDEWLGHKKKISVSAIVILMAFAFPWLYDAPDSLYENPFSEATGYSLQVELLDSFNTGEPAEELKKGKKIVCFFSTSCRFCRYSAKKLSLIQKNFRDTLPIYYVLWGTEDSMQEFWEETQSYKFPYQLVEADIFFPLSGNQLPAIYFLENGIVAKKLTYRGLNEQEVIQFLGPSF